MPRAVRREDLEYLVLHLLSALSVNKIREGGFCKDFHTVDLVACEGYLYRGALFGYVGKLARSGGKYHHLALVGTALDRLHNYRAREIDSAALVYRAHTANEAPYLDRAAALHKYRRILAVCDMNGVERALSRD